MKKLKNQLTFVVEWDADNPNLHRDIVQRALHFFLGVQDGIASNEFHDIPGSASDYHPHGPIRVLWHGETLPDWAASRTSDHFPDVEYIKKAAIQ